MTRQKSLSDFTCLCVEVQYKQDRFTNCFKTCGERLFSGGFMILDLNRQSTVKPYNISSKLLQIYKFPPKNVGNLKRAKSSQLSQGKNRMCSFLKCKHKLSAQNSQKASRSRQCLIFPQIIKHTRYSFKIRELTFIVDCPFYVKSRLWPTHAEKYGSKT